KQIRIKHIGISFFLVFQNILLLGQFDFPDSVRSRFGDLRLLQEKIFLHSDKSFYLTGEIVWFKLYDVDASLHRPLDLSKIGYVEILAADQKPLFQAKIELRDGIGHGSFFIPSSINSGNYRLRAYTNWMKNFSADFYFEKTITIVNPLKAGNKNIRDPSQ